MNFLSADVPDPTDFPPHTLAPGLRALDGSLRCDICGELYDAPVTIACGHCFCSTCIRNCLASKQECPSCRKSSSEVHIRPNPIMEKVISEWKEARPFILRLLKQEEERAAISTQADKGTSKKRKRSTEHPSSVETHTAGPSRNPLLPNGKGMRPKSPPSRPKKLMPKYDEVIDITIPSSDIEEDEYPSTNPLNFVPKADDLVKCPICQNKVRYQKLNSHIDNNCKDGASGEKAAKTWSKIMGGAKNGQHKGKHKKKGSDSDDEYPLPISSYTTLKDKQLKEMLQHHDLPLTGDRSNWEQRHQRWVMLFNANLDRSIANRKNKDELRKDLKKWEEDTAKKKKVVIHDVIGYQIEQKAEFTKLINAARQTKSKAPSRSTDAAVSSSPPLPLPISTNQPTPLPPQSSATEAEDTIVVDSEEER